MWCLVFQAENVERVYTRAMNLRSPQYTRPEAISEAGEQRPSPPLYEYAQVYKAWHACRTRVETAHHPQFAIGAEGYSYG